MSTQNESETREITGKVERRSTRMAASINRIDGQPPRVEGYAAVFYRSDVEGTQYRMYPDLVERIDSGAFNRAIAEKHDCRCLVNHDPNLRLGRVKNDTLQLRVDDRGLFYSCELPDTQVGRDTATDLASGLLDASSFAFSVAAQRWEDIKQDDGSMLTIRTITDVDLYDCAPVTYPAYEATSSGLRTAESTDDVIAQRDAWRSAQREAEAVKVRLRALEVAEAE